MPAPMSPNLRPISHFPILECFHAFDGALSACGINGSAELVYAGLPMVWLPYANASRDQIPNVQRNLDRGFGIAPVDKSPQALANAIVAILDPARAATMRRAMEAERAPNGADLAAEYIAAWLAGPRLPSAATTGAAAAAGDA